MVYRRIISFAPIIVMSFQQKDEHFFAEVSDWSQQSNRAVREMLDHVAEELAKEYVRLMEASAEREEGE